MASTNSGTLIRRISTADAQSRGADAGLADGEEIRQHHGLQAAAHLGDLFYPHRVDQPPFLLGRGVVVRPGAEVPEAWTAVPAVAVADQISAGPEPIVERLHRRDV